MAQNWNWPESAPRKIPLVPLKFPWFKTSFFPGGIPEFSDKDGQFQDPEEVCDLARHQQLGKQQWKIHHLVPRGKLAQICRKRIMDDA